MTRIDQFESAFKSAAKTRFAYETVAMDKVLLVTDLSDYEGQLYCDRARSFLSVLGEKAIWATANGDEARGVAGLFEVVERERPALICTYRHLHSDAKAWSYGLGEHLDVLTQATTTPVLVLPRPDDEETLDQLRNTDTVMALTSQLPGDHHLVSVAAHFTEPGGKLYLSHVEDEKTYERYISAIGKIPFIDTDQARTSIKEQLLKGARDYMSSCAEELDRAGIRLTLEPIVTMGHHLGDHKRLVESHAVDLLVFNTKDDDQLAMHGLARPLAVELRRLPLLML